MSQFRFTIRDIWKKPAIYVFFIIQLFLATVCLSIPLEQMVYSASRRQLTNHFNDFDITFFSPYMETSSGISDGFPVLKKILEEKAGYSTISYMKLPDSDTESGPEIIIGLGAFAEVFGIEGHGEGTSVLIGNKVRSLDMGDSIELEVGLENVARKYNVNGRLPTGSIYIPDGAVYSLDNSVVVLTDDLEPLFLSHFHELIFNAALINANSQDIHDFAIAIKDATGIVLYPTDSSVAAKRLNQLYRDGYIFTSFFVVTLTFVIFGVIINILQLMDSNLREHSIHLLIGARMHHLYIRTIAYVLIQISLPLFLSAHAITILRPVAPLPLPILALLLAVFTFLIALVPIMKLSKQDFTLYLRSDG